MSKAKNYPADEGWRGVGAVGNSVRDTGVRPVTHIATEVSGPNRRDETPDERMVAIRDARPIADRITLEDNGFMLVRNDTAVTDFLDPAQIETVWNAEVDALKIGRASCRDRVCKYV